MRAGSSIAIQQFVLQGCVVSWEEKLYCKTGFCIVTAGAVGCWTVSRHRAATRPARSRYGTGRRWALRHGAGRYDTARRARSKALRHGAGRCDKARAQTGAWQGRSAGLRAVYLVNPACF